MFRKKWAALGMFARACTLPGRAEGKWFVEKSLCLEYPFLYTWFMFHKAQHLLELWPRQTVWKTYEYVFKCLPEVISNLLFFTVTERYLKLYQCNMKTGVDFYSKTWCVLSAVSSFLNKTIFHITLSDIMVTQASWICSILTFKILSLCCMVEFLCLIFIVFI